MTKLVYVFNVCNLFWDISIDISGTYRIKSYVSLPEYFRKKIRFKLNTHGNLQLFKLVLKQGLPNTLTFMESK